MINRLYYSIIYSIYIVLYNIFYYIREYNKSYQILINKFNNKTLFINIDS